MKENVKMLKTIYYELINSETGESIFRCRANNSFKMAQKVNRIDQSIHFIKKWIGHPNNPESKNIEIIMCEDFK